MSPLPPGWALAEAADLAFDTARAQLGLVCDAHALFTQYGTPAQAALAAALLLPAMQQVAAAYQLRQAARAALVQRN